MNLHPIQFGGEMVRAIVDGRKSQTRRVIKPQPKPEWNVTDVGVMCGGKHDGEWSWMSGDPNDVDSWMVEGHDFRCPYGQPGDLLWVRERCWIDRASVQGLPLRAFFDNGYVAVADGRYSKACYGWQDGWTPEELEEVLNVNSSLKRTPPIHMPLWACRLFLRVEAVRAERLQDISEQDAIAEGVTVPATDDGRLGIRVSGKHPPINYLPPGAVSDQQVVVAYYASLWDSINAKRAGGAYAWAKNPWVWVVTFRVLSSVGVDGLPEAERMLVRSHVERLAGRGTKARSDEGTKGQRRTA